MRQLTKSTWFRYGLLLAWMGIIFYASATPDLRAVPWAQRFGFLPAILGAEATDHLELLLRKSAHMLSFGLLALLARGGLATGVPRVAAGRHSLVAFGFALLYALSDEYHQSFVPSREASLIDVMIDAVGAGIALLAVRPRREIASRSAGE